MSQQPPPPGWDQSRPGPPPAYPPPPPGGQAYGPPGGYGYQQQQPPPPSRGLNAMALASMICSVSLFGVGSLLAIIFGIIAKKQIRERGESGSAMATAGLIIGGIGLVAGVLWLALVVVGTALDDDALGTIVLA